MRRPLAALFLLIFALLVVGSFAFLRSQAAADLLCAQIEARGAKWVDGTVLVGRCELDPLSVALAFHDVAIRSPRRGIELDVDRLELKLREVQAPSEQVLVDSLVVRGPRLRVDLARLEAARDPAAATWDGCGLPELPLRVLSGEVEEAELTLRRGDAPFLEVADLSVSTRGWGQSLSARIASASGTLHVGAAEPLSFSGVAAEGEVQTEGMIITTGGISAEVGGLATHLREGRVSLCELSAAWSAEVEGELERWLTLAGASPELRETARGQLALKVNGSGSILDPGLGGALHFREASLDHFWIGNSSIEATLEGEEVQLTRLVTDAMKGELEVKGTIGLAEPYPARLAVKVKEGSLEALVGSLGLPGAWVDARISGGGSLEGSLHPLDLRGPADLQVVDFVTLDRPVREGPGRPDETFLTLPPATVKTPVRVTADTISVTGGEVALANSRVNVQGDFPLSGNAPVALTGLADSIDLGQDIPRIADMPYSGVVKGPFSLTGPYSDLRIEGRLGGRAFSVDGIEAGVVTGQLVFEDMVISVAGAAGQRGRTQYVLNEAGIRVGEDPKDFTFDIAVAEGRLEDLIPALENWHPLARRFSGTTGEASGSIHVEGPLEKVSFQLEARAAKGVLEGQPYESLSLRGGLIDRERFQIDEARIRVGADDLTTVRGFAVIDGELGLSIATRELPLERLHWLEGEGLEGRVSGDLVTSGTWMVPKVTGALALEGLRTRGIDQGQGKVQVSLEGDALTLRGGLDGERLGGTVKVDLDGGGLELELAWKEQELARWIPVLDTRGRLAPGWDGASEGSLRLTGHPERLSSWRGAFSLTRLRVKREKLELALAGGAELQVRDGTLATRGLTVISEASSIHLRGSAGQSEGLDLTLSGTLGLAALASLLPELDAASGTLELQASVGGAWERPTLVGSGRVVNAGLATSFLPFEIEALGGEVTFSQRAVVFDGFTGIAGRGRIDLSGELHLERLMPKRIHLVTRLDEVRIAPTDELQLTLAGALFLDGPAGDLFLSGNLQAVRGRYEAELGVEGLLPWAQSRKASLSESSEDALPLRLDVTLQVPGTMVVATPELDMRLQGDLRLLGTLASPGLLGTVDALEGEAKFRGNRFRVSHAVVDFQSPDRIDPTFDVNAEAEVRDYRVHVHAFGSPEEPRVILTSEPELAEADLLTLLTLGLTARDAEGLDGGEAAFAVMDALFSATGLDRQVKRFLPDNEILRAPRLRLTSGYSAGTGQVEPRVAFESRLFTDALRLRYSAPIGAPGQRATAEVRITDTISAQAEWDTENRESEVGNLGVDLKLRWELE
ncbi:MAG: translocation/assembly module TamB domain-containing protein [Deltaproteobacteria bacterium]|nr:translocation/assembly module TamB domain-containing protein [Deltaproteobacteria bacterium]